jgi:hypothetical protein
MTDEQVKQYGDSVVGNIPLGRTGTLDEIAKAVSDRAYKRRRSE